MVKPLHGKAGEGVRVGRDGTNLTALSELFGSIWKEPFIVQAFSRGRRGRQKDRAGRRRSCRGDQPPAQGRRISVQSRRRRHGRASRAHRPRARICAAIGPELKRRGLLFVGIDVIGGLMTEINVTSPTGIVAIDKFNGSDTPG